LPSLETIERQADAFCDISSNIQRRSPLVNLWPETTEEVATHLLKYQHGESFFRRDDPADRMYIIASGEVGLIHSTDRARKCTILHQNDAFGGMAFFTSALHTSAAIAAQETAVWELRRQDLLELLQNVPEFVRGMREYLKQPDAADQSGGCPDSQILLGQFIFTTVRSGLTGTARFFRKQLADVIHR